MKRIKGHWVIIACLIILLAEVGLVYFKPSPHDLHITPIPTPEGETGDWRIINGELWRVAWNGLEEGYAPYSTNPELDPWAFLPLITVVVIISAGIVWYVIDDIRSRPKNVPTRKPTRKV